MMGLLLWCVQLHFQYLSDPLHQKTILQKRRLSRSSVGIHSNLAPKEIVEYPFKMPF